MRTIAIFISFRMNFVAICMFFIMPISETKKKTLMELYRRQVALCIAVIIIIIIIRSRVPGYEVEY